MAQSNRWAVNGETKMLATLRNLVHDLVPDRDVSLDHIDTTTWAIWLKTSDGEVELDAISQGMSSILNWVGVLLRRLYDVYPRSQEPEKERALVLVDEIDAHLHPSWQRRLVDITRRFFPNVQIVATSHSPLLAGAVKREELRIVERDCVSGKMVVSPAREDLEGQRVEDILISSLFALDTTRSPGAERDIKAFIALFEKRVQSESDREAMKDLSERMVQLNFGTPPGSSATAEPAADPVAQMAVELDSLSEEAVDTLRARLAASGPAGDGGAQTREET